MTAKSKFKPDDKDQSDAFREAAREHGADDSSAAFEKAIKTILPERRGRLHLPNAK